MKLGTRVWGLITFVVVVGVVAAGWFLGVSPQLAAKANSESQRQAAVSQNQSIEMTIAKLKAEQENTDSYEARDAELVAAIPSDLESAAFITALNDLATATGVTIQQFSLDDVVPYAEPEAEAASDGAPSPVTDSRITADNFLLVPVTLAVSGSWDQVLAFTHGVQTGNRLMLVTKVDTSGDETTYTTTLSGTIYVLVRPEMPATSQSDADTATTEASAASS
ncbi:MAG: hypothetical protein QM675_08590 [Protaetiibacter sp.]